MLACLLPILSAAFTLPAQAATAAAELAGGLDAQHLLTLGVNLGIIAFAVGTAIACLRATERAREARDAAALEAERFRAREDMLEMVLAAEPQMLLTWTEADGPRVLAANLPPALGVPREPERLLRFAEWLDGPSAEALDEAVRALTERGEAFNLMLRTHSQKHVEVDGRTAGGAVALKVRDVAGRRLELASLADKHKALDGEIAVLRALLDALQSPAWLRGADRRLVWVNRSYAEAVAAPSPEGALSDQIELLDRATRRAIEKALQSGQTFHARIETLAGYGTRRYDASVVEIEGASAGIAVDASLSDLDQQELKRGLEARFRSFDRLATAFAVFGADQRLTHFNQAYVELWQLDPEWLLNHPRDGEILDRLRQARRLPEKADYQDWKRTWLSAYGSNAQSEDEWHLPDGRTLHVIADSAPEGGVTYLYENVTERLALESRYNALIHVQRETLDTLREGVAVFAPNGRLRLYNPAFAAIWRLSPRQLDSEPHIEEIIDWCRVLYDNAEEWERTKASVTAIVSARRSYESQFDRPDGSVIACAALPLPDGGALLTYVDVSDSKAAERALIERNEALEAADRMKTAFVSHVSYELRTPLTNIIGFSELLASPLSGPLSEKQRDYLGDIRSSGRTLLSIIDDILDLATIDAGTFELKLSPVEVREVVEAAALGVRERLKQNGVELEIGIDADVGNFIADGRRVTQILYNLLSNAIGFSPADGKIVLTCGRASDMLAFTVQDQGCGIPEDYQHSVFDRFESRSHGSRHHGAGLGLTIVKSLVELHAGTVALASSPGRGTWVRVLLPLKQEAPADEAGLAERLSYPTSRAG
jgi:signal transduction histidine kinase